MLLAIDLLLLLLLLLLLFVGVWGVGGGGVGGVCFDAKGSNSLTWLSKQLRS